MTHKTRYLVPVVALLLIVGAMSPATAAPQDQEDSSTRIHIERSGSGEEGERVHSRSHVIFIGDEGEIQEIEGEGEGFAWIDGEHGKHVRMLMPRISLRDGAFLGVSTTALTPELRSHFGAPEDAGVLISKVVDDSAAFSAGLLVGDIITAIDGERITSSRDLLHEIRSREEGDAVTVEIYRDGRVEDIAATLGKTESIGPRLDDERFFHRFPRAMKIDCDDDGGDCDIFMKRRLDVCEGDGSCDVKISCDGGECSCTVNGEATDCDTLSDVHVHPND